MTSSHSENTSLSAFAIFPEPNSSKTWMDATKYVESNAPSGGTTPQWNPSMVPGKPWTDPTTGQSFTVPGNGDYVTKGRDPYGDLVALAKDLGAAGVDIDYEEMWHADKFKEGSEAGENAHRSDYSTRLSKGTGVLGGGRGKGITHAQHPLPPTSVLSHAGTLLFVC